MADWLRSLDTLTMFEAMVAEGREFNPRPGQYSRKTFVIRPGDW